MYTGTFGNINGMGKSTITGQINAKALELLEQFPQGLSWSELLKKNKGIRSSSPPQNN